MRRGSILFGVGVLFASVQAAAVTVDWVTVGNPGNSCDIQPGGCFGSVADVYRISKYETTNAQYTEFLNAVAATDTHALYNTNMAGSFGGITRSGSSGSYSYSAVTGRQSKPVNFVSFYDTLRFANWLHNGQPMGAQGSGTTEDGSYLMSLGASVVRESGATVFLPSEDEWFKAAYYNGASYFDYPAGTDTGTLCTLLDSGNPNTANCNNAVTHPTDVGFYMSSGSPYGTYDQGGNVDDWNEAIFGPHRVTRGGSFESESGELSASARGSLTPSDEFSTLGFRTGSLVPEPQTGLLVMTGLLVLANWRRRRA